MTDLHQDPLSAAQALLETIRDSVSDSAIRAQLTDVRRLLEKAAEGTISVEAGSNATAPNTDAGKNSAAIKAELDRVIQETASFASLMVHEIRKPMTSIRGYIDMLAKPGMVGDLNPMQTQFVTTVRTNVLRMEGLVSDISDISKLSSGRLRLDSKMTTFGQIMLDVQKQAEALITEYGHTVTYDVPQGLPILNVDAKQLTKVIFYLLKNAIQYTPKGDGQITLKAERLEANTLKVMITDNGIGLSAEEIGKLGELFYRADNEHVATERGYGLGVPITIGFLKLLGGTMLPVQSEPGKGSTFGFTLPGMG